MININRINLRSCCFFFLVLLFLFPILNLILDFSYIGFQKFDAKSLHFFTENLLIFTIVTLFSLLLGFVLAWHDVFHDFYGKKLINCLIIASLAFPSYINAFIYVKIFENFGLLHQMGLPQNFFFDFRTKTGYIITMIASFYPYSYIIFKINLPQIKSLILLSQTCRLKMQKILFKIVLPLQKSVIIGSTLIILMELLADFGVANELAVNNFSIILYRKWFIQHSQDDAIKFIIQMLFVVLIVFLVLVKKKQNTLQNHQNHSYEIPKFKRNPLILFLSTILILFSFCLPIACMLYWASQSLNCKSLIKQLPTLTYNTIFISILTSIILIFFSLLINFIYTFGKKNNFLKFTMHLPYLAYCIPGMIIVLSVMLVNKKLIGVVKNPNIVHFLQSSFSLLIYVYCIRFLSVSLNTIGNGNAVGKNSLMLTKIYNIGAMKKFFTIYLPLIKTNVILAFLFISSEIVKELPMTLIIRPFNFETLATKVNNLVSEEKYNETSLPSLIIVGLEIVLIYFLQKGTRDGDK